MTWTADEYAELRNLAAARFPHDVIASSRETWDAWRPSLQARFTPAQVAAGLILCSEAREKFPPLAALMGAIRGLIEQDQRPTLRLAAPRARTIEQRLREFDAELPANAQAGPFTTKARQLLADGWEPGQAAEAMVHAFSKAAGKEA